MSGPAQSASAAPPCTAGTWRLPFEAWFKLNKVLRIKFAVAGGRTGTFTARPRTAMGTATSRGRIVRPAPKVFPAKSIIPAVRRGEELIIPKRAAFTCSRTGLHLHQRSTRQGVTVVLDWWFRRV